MTGRSIRRMPEKRRAAPRAIRRTLFIAFLFVLGPLRPVASALPTRPFARPAAVMEPSLQSPKPVEGNRGPASEFHFNGEGGPARDQPDPSCRCR
jgi:hypothetical protein